MSDETSRTVGAGRAVGSEADQSASQLVAVVMLAFGPRSTTRGLVKSIKRFGVQNNVDHHVVDAIDAAGVPVGRDGLMSVLGSIGEGPVLFMHDDVAVDPTSIGRLLGAHLASGAIAVPLTNDSATSHFVGALPPASVARSELKRLERDSASVERAAELVRPSCLVADAADLLALVHDTRSHDPFTTLRVRDLKTVIVTDAYAAHDAMCGQQIRETNLSLDTPLLVASMIVRDEQELLPGCLESLEGLVDRIEIVDTGSVDETVEIARRHGAGVTTTEWRDDFALARNVAADQCRDATFTLWIDADERAVVADVDLLRDLLRAYADEFESLDLVIENLSDGSTPTSSFRARRIVRSELLEFHGAIHEAPVRRGAADRELESAVLDLISIEHLGYSDAVVNARDKKARNLNLARAQSAESDSSKASLDLARSIMMAGGDPAEAVSVLRGVIADTTDSSAEVRAYLNASLGHMLLEACDATGALEHASEAFLLCPTDDLAAAVLTMAATELGQPETLLSTVERASGAARVEPVYRSATNREIHDLGVVKALAAVGRCAEAWDHVCLLLASNASADHWEVLGEVAGGCFGGVELVEKVLPIAVAHGDVGPLVSACARRAEPAGVALLALALRSSGVSGAGTVSVGLVAAMAGELWNIFDELVVFVEEVDSPIRAALGAKLRDLGDEERVAKVTGHAGHRPLISRLGGVS